MKENTWAVEIGNIQHFTFTTSYIMKNIQIYKSNSIIKKKNQDAYINMLLKVPKW